MQCGHNYIILYFFSEKIMAADLNGWEDQKKQKQKKESCYIYQRGLVVLVSSVFLISLFEI